MIDLRKCKTKFPESLLRIGTHIEMEHTTNKDKARKIARQHMCEMGTNYYPSLIAMEKRLKNKKG